VKDVLEIIEGKLFKGSENSQVLDATFYEEYVDKANTLFFLKMKWKIDWEVLKAHSPITIVTDKIFDEFDSINECNIILVNDVQTAIWKFVDHYRNSFQIPVIAVTGTSGKTTTKDIIKHILSQSLNIKGTEYSANGCTGHLLYLMRWDEQTQAAVYETAVGSPGDITYACKYFKPKIGIITNIGIDHLDRCKTKEEYIMAKEEMLTVLPDDGILILNSDDENCKKINTENFKGRIVYFGINPYCHFWASNVEFGEFAMNFILNFQGIKYPVSINGYGEHLVYNALAAIAAVHELGIGINESIERLKSFKQMNFHFQFVKGIQDCTVIDDTWNLNLTSLRAALKTLKEIETGKKKVVFVGNFLGLGEYLEEIHVEAGKLIAEIGGMDVLIAMGEFAHKIAEVAHKGGFDGQIFAFSNSDGVIDVLQNMLDKNTIILVKCSMFDDSFKNLLKKVIIK
jgi:UDP-N-acetylmuramoyl-tripeptide--D-alanyl-D-alanine ligase